MIFFRANECPQASPRQLETEHSATIGQAKAEMQNLAHALALVSFLSADIQAELPGAPAFLVITVSAQVWP